MSQCYVTTSKSLVLRIGVQQTDWVSHWSSYSYML